MSSAVPVDLKERLEVLFWQEITCYRTDDYLGAFRRSQAEVLATLPTPTPNINVREAVTEASTFFGIGDDATGEQIKEHWRDVICEWAYNLVDHFDLPRERVSVFANLLDRYLQKYLAEHPGGMSKKHFQLVSLACLYLTVKLDCHHGFLSIDMMIHLSREKFSKNQMLVMEKELLGHLDWKLHPPTPHVFLRHFLLLLEPGRSVPHNVIESARFFVELAALDYQCVPQRPSRIALAALLNAIEQDMTASEQYLSSCVGVVRERQYNFVLSLIAPSDQESVNQCRSRLMELFDGVAVDDDDDTMGGIAGPCGGRMTSPVSVAHACPLA